MDLKRCSMDAGMGERKSPINSRGKSLMLLYMDIFQVSK